MSAKVFGFPEWIRDASRIKPFCLDDRFNFAGVAEYSDAVQPLEYVGDLIDFTVPTWERTPQIRIVMNRRLDIQECFEQAWVCHETGEIKWRPVEVVYR